MDPEEIDKFWDFGQQLDALYCALCIRYLGFRELDLDLGIEDG
jgi:hypothetical protein